MLALTITLLSLGLALLALGLIGRRIGDEPRCRKCKYNLTGVESKTCPECGRPWTPETAAKGLRLKRKRPLAIGGVLLLLGGALTAAITTGYLQKTNWFTRLPTNWVIPFAAKGNTDAFTVLADRFDNGKLAPTDIAQLIETALTVQADPQLRETTQDWIDLLARLEARGNLTTEQRDRFYRQMVLLKLVMRRPTARDQYIDGELHKRWRAPKNTYLIWRLDMLSSTLDGQPFDVHSRGMIGHGANYLNPRGSRTLSDAEDKFIVVGPGRTPALGIHELQLNCRSEFQSFTARRRHPVWSGDQVLRATVEFVDRKKTPKPQTVDDPETIQRILAALEFTVTASPSYRGKSRTLAVDWRLAAPSPTDAWIEVRTRPRRGAIAGFFDFEESIYLPQGQQHEIPIELGSLESTKLAPGDTLTLWLYSEDGSYRGVGTTRLKPGLLLGQVQVPIQSTPPPTTPRATGT